MRRPPANKGRGSPHNIYYKNNGKKSQAEIIGADMAGFAEIHLTDNSHMVLAQFEAACKVALEACGLDAEGYAKENLTSQGAVDTGALRNSITHKVIESEKACYIGTDMEYGAYVELGTGIYAMMGGGRSDPWVYCDGKGQFHMTNGRKATPYLKPAVADHANEYRSTIESVLKK